MQDILIDSQETDTQEERARPLTAGELLEVAGGPQIENDTQPPG